MKTNDINRIIDDAIRMKLAQYIADYINEELARGNTDIDKYMIADAIDAYEGGAE